MEVLRDGSYKTKDGTVIPANEVGKLYKAAPRAPKAQEEAKKSEDEELKEGQASGVIDLCEG